LNGFEFTMPDNNEAWGLYLVQPYGVVVENCCFRSPTQWTADGGIIVPSWTADGDGPPLVVRDCFIAGRVNVNSVNRYARVLLQRNYFAGGQARPYLGFGQSFDAIVVRQNVFSADGAKAVAVGARQSLQSIDITNNTILSQWPISFYEWGPWDNVRVAGNLHADDGLLALFKSENLPTAARAKWRIGRNAYPRQLERGELGLAEESIVPAAPTDQLGKIDMLSSDATSRDYPRIPADSPLAKQSPGGELPGYIGALPPGPAPREGDWFTRLRERWDKSVKAE
jgi:hypothetical protein